MSAWLSRQTVRRIGRWCGWVAAILLLFTVLTGYGITQFRVVGRLTFGILDKATSHRMHHYTDIPMIVVLGIHMAIAVWGRFSGRRQEVH